MAYPPAAPFKYIKELTSRITAETGLPSDQYHVGKILLRSFKDAPDFLSQIDGASDKKENFQLALERSVRCATAFRNFGLKYQDVIVVMAPNHIDLTTPLYAAMYLGIMFAGVDTTLRVNELQVTFKCCVPKIVFCQSSNLVTVRESLNLANVSAQIVAFDENEDVLSFSKFLEKCGDNTTPEVFKPADFNPSETVAMLVPTSGTTGIPKVVALSHENVMLCFPILMISLTKFPTPVNLSLVLSPVQWLSAIFHFILGPILRYTRLQTSSAATQEHVYFLINKYRPDSTFLSPTFLITLMKDKEKCDFSSIQLALIGGNAVSNELVREVKSVIPNVSVMSVYGMTEAGGIILDASNAPFGSVGKGVDFLQYKLVDPVTNEVICKPNVTGELHIKGPTIFKGYYNNPEMTGQFLNDDGWFKSGDMLYRDGCGNYYFYDRIKLLLKYKNYQMSPLEIEAVIIKHPSVRDVAVTGIPDAECGDLPVAVVMLREGHKVTAQEIKDLVRESLSDTKRLRGGVIFVNELPVTSTSKLDRQKLKKLALTLDRE